MAAVSSLGIGSGLDLNTLLAGMKSAEQAPLNALQKQQTSYTTRLSAYGQLSGALSGLQSAAAALAKPALFQGVKVNSTASDVVAATALSTASNGTYMLNVSQLAQAQSLATTGVLSNTAAIGGGTLTIQLGTVSGTSADPLTGKFTGAVFTAGVTAALPISIAAGSSMTGIRDAINGNASSGVTASIVSDGSAMPNRLVLTSKLTGVASSMQILVTGDAALSSLLQNDPAGTQNMQQTSAAQNTLLTVNGIAITSPASSVAGAIENVTMTVAKVGVSTLKVEQDKAGVQSAVSTFVAAYNSLQSVASRLTAFDPASKSGAILLGDSTLRTIQTGIRSALTSAQTDDGSGLTMLSQIGVSFQKDGTLALDASKLTASLDSNMSGVAHLFSAGTGGFGSKMSKLLGSYTDGTDGVLTAATQGINKTLDSLARQFTVTSERIDATISRYKAQFTQLDMMMSRMNKTSSYLTQQFDALNNTNNK